MYTGRCTKQERRKVLLSHLISMRTWLVLVWIALPLLACDEASPEVREARSTTATAGENPRKKRETKLSVFDLYMAAGIPPADGFDFPFGDRNGKGAYIDKATGKKHTGWQVATAFAESYSLGIHTGEDWNGSGGGNTDLGQDVFAIGDGRVVFAGDCGRLWGNVIIIEHLFYENDRRRTIRSVYAHLQKIYAQRGERVQRRQRIAAIGQDPERLSDAHLHLELRWDATLSPAYWPASNGKNVAWVKEHYTSPEAFIRSHRTLPVPQKEETLLLVDQASYRMRLYKSGKTVGEYEISFGQGRGQKRLQGDSKTPKGMYFVIAKRRGMFGGEYGGYFGGHWIRLNYPNSYDAAWGRSEGVISAAQEELIGQRWARREATLENTRLGGGIGIHGWIREWNNDGPRHLSWGCVVMHLYDIEKVYDQIPTGTMVVIF